MKVQGKTILITGSGRGIGKSLAMNFAKGGAKTLFLWDIDEVCLMESTAEIQKQFPNVDVRPVVVDISEKNNIQRAEPSEKDQVDILVNNAGLIFANNLLDFPEERIRKIFNVNIISQSFIVQKYLPGMLSRGGGQVVTIASAGGVIGANLLSGYSATKFACRGFHESMRLELYSLPGGENIETTIIFPYYVNTRMSIGVKSLFPVMETDDITPKMLRAIEKGKAELFLPGMFRWSNLLVRFLPPRIMDKVLALLGFTKSMDEHVDRKKPKKVA